MHHQINFNLKRWYTYLIIIYVSSACESNTRKLPLAGFTSLYTVQFVLTSSCPSEYNLPHTFETQLKISTPNRLISTSVDSVANHSFLLSSSQLATLDFDPSPFGDPSDYRRPGLFNNLELIGQSCLDSVSTPNDSIDEINEARTQSLCFIGYQELQFQTKVQQTQSVSPFSTCQLDVFFPSNPQPELTRSQSRIDLEQNWNRFEKTWNEFVQNGSNLDQTSLCCDPTNAPFPNSIRLIQSRDSSLNDPSLNQSTAPNLVGTFSGQLHIEIDGVQSNEAALNPDWPYICGGHPECTFEYQIIARPMEE
jgi:hypothetical protein